jgi:hypothetical protein
MQTEQIMECMLPQKKADIGTKSEKKMARLEATIWANNRKVEFLLDHMRTRQEGKEIREHLFGFPNR